MNTSNSDTLQGAQLLTVVSLSFLLTPLAGAFYYYHWKDSQPNKAKMANRIAWLSLLVWGGIIAILQWFDYIDILS